MAIQEEAPQRCFQMNGFEVALIVTRLTEGYFAAGAFYFKGDCRSSACWRCFSLGGATMDLQLEQILVSP